MNKLQFFPLRKTALQRRLERQLRRGLQNGKQLASPRRLLIAGGAIGLGAAIFLVGSFFLPRNVQFSVAGDNCLMQPLLFPDLISKQQSAGYRAEPRAAFSVGSLAIYSHQTCIEPSQAPQEGVRENIAFGSTFLSKRIAVTTAALPQLANAGALAQPIATREPFVVELTSKDLVFDYALAANNRTADCSVDENTVRCDTAKLELAQSATYGLVLYRTFNDQPAGVVFQQSISTVEAMSVAAASIASGQIVFAVPTEILVTLNRPAIMAENARLELVAGETRTAVPATFTLTEATLRVSLVEPLARSASFELIIPDLRAADGGYLPQPFILPFVTSGGPKVVGINIGNNKVDASSNIILTFDTGFKAGQNLANFIKLEVGGKTVEASVTAKGNKVTINPAANMPACTTISVRVLDGLQNEFGISGGSAWQRNSRVLCKTTFSIGSSVKGRSIVAHKFGSGGSKIIFVGGTHGNEKSSVYLLNSFSDYLEANPDKIPAHRTVIIIPNLNPDGFAASTRTNANNVDLNRNFPANDWKQGVIMPGGSFNPNGGGSAPLSEPESRALANYVLSQNPRLVLTYHAAGGIVMPNDSGDSIALAKVYDQKSNLGYASKSQTGSLFPYDTTGAFEDWLHDKHGIATLLIELWTKSGNEFSKNRDAMLYMSQLP